MSKSPSIYAKSVRKRRKCRRAMFFFVLFAVLLTVCLIFLFFFLKKEESVQPANLQFPVASDQQQIGTLETRDRTEKNFCYGVHFPKLGNEPIDQTIQGYVDGIISRFEADMKDYKPESQEVRPSLVVDYESYLHGESIVSVVLHTDWKEPEKGSDQEQVKSFVFDLQSGKEMKLADFFQGNYLDTLSSNLRKSFQEDQQYVAYTSQALFTEATKPAEQSFQTFAFDKEQIYFYYNPGQIFDGISSVVREAVNIDSLNFVLKEGTGIQFTKPVVDMNKPMLALTFDDGPKPATTNRILDLLEQVGGRATFFVLGTCADKGPDYQECLKRAHDLGCDIENHTYGHKTLTQLSPEEMQTQIQSNSDLIRKITGEAPALLRPPGGEINDAVKANAKYPLVLWSVDPKDWKTKDPATTIQLVRENAADGDIILLHDIYPTTVEACETLIPELAQKFQLVTVEELFAARGIGMEPGQKYTNAHPAK